MLYRNIIQVNAWSKYLDSVIRAVYRLTEKHDLNQNQLIILLIMNIYQKENNVFFTIQDAMDISGYNKLTARNHMMYLISRGYIERVERSLLRRKMDFYNVTALGNSIETGFNRLMNDYTGISGSPDKRAKRKQAKKRNYSKELNKYFHNSKHGKEGFQGTSYAYTRRDRKKY